MTSGGKRKNAGRKRLGQTKAILVELTPEMKQAVQQCARAKGQSMNAFIVQILQISVEAAKLLSKANNREF